MVMLFDGGGEDESGAPRFLCLTSGSRYVLLPTLPRLEPTRGPCPAACRPSFSWVQVRLCWDGTSSVPRVRCRVPLRTG